MEVRARRGRPGDPGPVMRFSKYQALGNDFIVVDGRPERGGDFSGDRDADAALAVALCDRRRGVGADGVLILRPGRDAVPWRMDIINADGSIAGMCGNGLRCMLAYCWQSGILPPEQGHTTFVVGERSYRCERLTESDFRVDMGAAEQDHSSLPRLAAGAETVTLELASGLHFTGQPAWLGNPHFVVFEQDGMTPESLRGLAETHGFALENHSAFPDRANISFVSRVREDTNRLNAVVHERGVGITDACGSGACAIAFAAVRLGKAQGQTPLSVQLPGGVLDIVFEAEQRLSMRGPARRVFAGEWCVV